jgi:hypothetical protein
MVATNTLLADSRDRWHSAVLARSLAGQARKARRRCLRIVARAKAEDRFHLIRKGQLTGGGKLPNLKPAAVRKEGRGHGELR